MLTASDATAAVFQLMTQSGAPHRTVQLDVAWHNPAQSRAEQSKDGALSFLSFLPVPKGAVGTHRGVKNRIDYSGHTDFLLVRLIAA